MNGPNLDAIIHLYVVDILIVILNMNVSYVYINSFIFNEWSYFRYYDLKKIIALSSILHLNLGAIYTISAAFYTSLRSNIMWYIFIFTWNV